MICMHTYVYYMYVYMLCSVLNVRIPNTTVVPTRRDLTVSLAIVRTAASLKSRKDQIEKDARELSLKIKDHQPGTTVSPHTYTAFS